MTEEEFELLDELEGEFEADCVMYTIFVTVAEEFSKIVVSNEVIFSCVTVGDLVEEDAEEVVGEEVEVDEDEDVEVEVEDDVVGTTVVSSDEVELSVDDVEVTSVEEDSVEDESVESDSAEDDSVDDVELVVNTAET